MNQPFHFSENSSAIRLGGVALLRATLSEYVAVEPSTSYAVDTIVHKYGEKWLMTLDASVVKFEGEILANLEAFGQITDSTFSAQVDEEVYAFSSYRNDFANYQGKNFTLEITLHNGSVIYLHEIRIDWKYKVATEIENLNFYTLTFRPAKKKDYPLDLIKYIQVKAVQMLLQNGSIADGFNIIVFPHDNVDKSNYDYLIGTTEDIDTATLASTNILYRSGGTYFVFVRIKNTNIYQTAYVNTATEYQTINIS